MVVFAPLLEGLTMQSAGAIELGYASAAILLGLFDHLLEKGIISRDDALSICDDAITSLAAQPNVGMKGASNYLKTAIRPEIAKHARS
jgi:hypothetical protein